MTIDRATLPEAPPPDIREGMAVAMIECPDYDGSDTARAMVSNIRAGRMVFIPPNIVKLTKLGYDIVHAAECEGD